MSDRDFASQPAVAVDDPEVSHVLHLRSGRVVPAVSLIQRIKGEQIISIRRALSKDKIENKVRYVCADCGVAVVLSASLNKRYFFRHVPCDQSCSGEARLSRQELRARVYRGLRESDLHKRTKQNIADSLSSDASFSNVHVEDTIRSSGGMHYRHPDVSAFRNEQRFVFEAQLNSTFLDVVNERAGFYQAEGGGLVWILRQFNPDRILQTERDLLGGNNWNILVVDEATLWESLSVRKFILGYWCYEPKRDGRRVVFDWTSGRVSFDELTIDVSRSHAFAVDCTAKKAAIDREILELNKEELFSVFERHDAPGTAELASVELKSWIEASAPGFHWPNDYKERKRLRTILLGLRSAELGRPMGFGFAGLNQVLHHLADNYPEAISAFAKVIESSGNTGALQDNSGKWKAKRSDHLKRYALNKDQYTLDANLDAFAKFLFPALLRKAGTVV